jgi:hypothetical protein
MAFEADGVNNGPAQESRVRGTVRRVAGFTTFDTNRRVLEQKRSPEIDVAFQTGLFIPQ